MFLPEQVVFKCRDHCSYSNTREYSGDASGTSAISLYCLVSTCINFIYGVKNSKILLVMLPTLGSVVSIMIGFWPAR